MNNLRFATKMVCLIAVSLTLTAAAPAAEPLPDGVPGQRLKAGIVENACGPSVERWVFREFISNDRHCGDGDEDRLKATFLRRWRSSSREMAEHFLIDPNVPTRTLQGVIAAGGTQPDPTRTNCRTTGGHQDSEQQCPSPQISDTDDCFNHFDRDMNIKVVVKPAKELLASITELNLTRDGQQAEFEVEWEHMFFSPQLITSRLEQPKEYRRGDDGYLLHQREGKDNVAVPWPGDQIAVQGVYISDCGHIDAKLLLPAREIHPPLVVAWAHVNDNKTADVFIRASAWATQPVPFHRAHEFAPNLDVRLPLKVAPGKIDWTPDYLADSYVPQCDRACFRRSTLSCPFRIVRDHLTKRQTPESMECYGEPLGHLRLPPSATKQSVAEVEKRFDIRLEAEEGGLRIRVRTKGPPSDEEFVPLVGVHARVLLE